MDYIALIDQRLTELSSTEEQIKHYPNEILDREGKTINLIEKKKTRLNNIQHQKKALIIEKKVVISIKQNDSELKELYKKKTSQQNELKNITEECNKTLDHIRKHHPDCLNSDKKIDWKKVKEKNPSIFNKAIDLYRKRDNLKDNQNKTTKLITEKEQLRDKYLKYLADKIKPYQNQFSNLPTGEECVPCRNKNLQIARENAIKEGLIDLRRRSAAVRNRQKYGNCGIQSSKTLAELTSPNCVTGDQLVLLKKALIAGDAELEYNNPNKPKLVEKKKVKSKPTEADIETIKKMSGDPVIDSKTLNIDSRKTGGTNPKDRKTIIKREFNQDTELVPADAKGRSDLEKAIKENRPAIVSVKFSVLSKIPEYGLKKEVDGNHAITITGGVYDENDQLTKVIVNDSNHDAPYELPIETFKEALNDKPYNISNAPINEKCKN